MNLTSFQRPELRDANNNVTQSGTYSVKNGVLTNAQNSGVLDYINNNLQAHQNAIETLQTGALQTKIVTSLPNPSVADANTIYMIKYTSGSDEYYYQYRFIDGSFVRVGDTKIDITDLTNKVTTNTTNIATLSSGKLNLSGGTMSGNLAFSSGNIIRSNDTGTINIMGGSAYNKGGYLYLCGKDNSSGARASLFANDGTNSSAIDLYANGTTSAPTPATTDNSTKIATTAFVNGGNIYASGTNYIRWANGLQICWGFETNTTDLSFTVTFPVAFSVKPSVNATYCGADASKNAVVNNVSVSNFVIIKTLANSWVCWQAIGKWK